MLEAILQQGQIVPLGPLPASWPDGVRLNIELAAGGPVDIDVWANKMNELCAVSSLEDEAIMLGAIAEHKKVAKEQMAKEMGLAE